MEYSDNLSGCKDCGNDCVGNYCTSCDHQRMVDKYDTPFCFGEEAEESEEAYEPLDEDYDEYKFYDTE